MRWTGNFPDEPLVRLNKKSLRKAEQILLQHQRVYSVGIVAGEGFYYAVAVAFVERQGGDVVYGGFQLD